MLGINHTINTITGDSYIIPNILFHSKSYKNIMFGFLFWDFFHLLNKSYLSEKLSARKLVQKLFKAPPDICLIDDEFEFRREVKNRILNNKKAVLIDYNEIIYESRIENKLPVSQIWNKSRKFILIKELLDKIFHRRKVFFNGMIETKIKMDNSLSRSFKYKRFLVRNRKGRIFNNVANIIAANIDNIVDNIECVYVLPNCIKIANSVYVIVLNDRIGIPLNQLIDNIIEHQIKNIQDNIIVNDLMNKYNLKVDYREIVINNEKILYEYFKREDLHSLIYRFDKKEKRR